MFWIICNRTLLNLDPCRLNIAFVPTWTFQEIQRNWYKQFFLNLKVEIKVIPTQQTSFPTLCIGNRANKCLELLLHYDRLCNIAEVWGKNFHVIGILMQLLLVCCAAACHLIYTGLKILPIFGKYTQSVSLMTLQNVLFTAIILLSYITLVKHSWVLDNF